MPGPFIKQYLMTAGPTPLPPEVSQAMAHPVVYHRSPAGVELYARVLERLPAVFGTANDVLLFSASGSGAMEACVANLVGPGDPVLACAAGKFGERWIDLCDAFGADTQTYEPGWGARLDPAEVDRRLGEHPDVAVCFATLSETSTGVVHDVRRIAEVCRAHDVLLCVDAVSGLGATELRQDEWGVDVVAAGSQKALMSPPGIGLVAASQRALDHAAQRPGGRFYFDFGATVRAQRKSAPDSPFTPPVTLLAAMDVALEMIHAEGLAAVLARHDLLARATRAGVHALGLELFGDPDERATVVTVVELPADVDGATVPDVLRDRFGVTALAGQGQIEGKVLRLAHCGYFGAFDVLTTLSALEMTLASLGHPVEQGAGVGAAQAVFLEAGVPAPA